MTRSGASIEAILDEQIRRWALLSRARREGKQLPELAITLSRLPGCAGREIAVELARRLKFDLFDKEILQQVAESTHLSESVVKTLDEKVMPAMEEWVTSLFLQRYLSEDYFRHLSRVLLAIGKHGHAVILGRGAGFILPSRECLRVLLVAPQDVRVRSLAYRMKMPLEDAKRQIIHVESDRRAFIRRHFHTDMTDATHYDIVINTQDLGSEGTLEAVRLAWETKKKVLAAGQPPWMSEAAVG
ncbi:MAG: cytidylate kinase-like family protein [Elusimicrobiota bacterium]|jgi:cytidylate kinase